MLHNGHHGHGHGRSQSWEKTFDLKVKNVIQVTYGHIPTALADYTRPVTTAFTCLTSQYPVPARFLDRLFVPAPDVEGAAKAPAAPVAKPAAAAPAAPESAPAKKARRRDS
jgi:hypothetical protein